MQEELKKSLTDLIDETLLELEELKKSRFSASEIEIKGPGADDLAGKPVNGKLDAAKAEDDEDKKDEDKKDEDEAEKSDVEKAEDKSDDKKDDDKKDDDKKDDKEEPKADPKHEEKEKDMAKKLLDMHKSDEKVADLRKSDVEMETLMKSYVDAKYSELEGKLSTILDTVTKLADAPVPARGVSYKGVAPLMKSNEAMEPMSKSEVASKLFDLKKSGTRVDSTDIARAEMGQDLEKIVAKYDIK